MTTILISYPGDADTQFDRAYYVDSHMPMVREAWTPHGLVSAAAFFPGEGGGGTVAMAVCTFRDDAAMQAAFAAAETKAVMADVKRFTDVRPVRSRAEVF